jgi:CheY-like chemotaxis protein
VETKVIPAQESPPVRILLVEDNPINQQVALGMLESLGYHTDLAPNGQAGLDALASKSYALVLMDCQMPEMDGFEATRLIREREAAADTSLSPQSPVLNPQDPELRTLNSSPPHVPIIALTANMMEGDREKCLAAGMNDYLGKPYTQEQLQAVLLRWLPNTLPLQQVRVVGQTNRETSLSSVPSQPTTLASGDQAQPIDPRAIEQIRALQRPGAPDILHKVIATYLQEAPQLLDAVRQAVAKDDAQALHHAAHSLKSTSAMLGAHTLAGLCKQLEALGHTHTTVNAAPLFAAVEAEYESVRTALPRML